MDVAHEVIMPKQVLKVQKVWQYSATAFSPSGLVGAQNDEKLPNFKWRFYNLKVPKSKNWRKQTCFKIQFYIGIQLSWNVFGQFWFLTHRTRSPPRNLHLWACFSLRFVDLFRSGIPRWICPVVKTSCSTSSLHVLLWGTLGLLRISLSLHESLDLTPSIRWTSCVLRTSHRFLSIGKTKVNGPLNFQCYWEWEAAP